MPKDNIIAGIDVGTSKVAVVAAQSHEGVVSILGVASVAHSGVRKGVVTDPEEVVSAISAVLEEIEKMSGMPVGHAYIGVNGSHVEAQPANGVVTISKPMAEIQSDDVDRVIEAARTVALPQNRELIHVFPHHFVVDSQEEIRDPIGMTGVRLEVHSLIVSASASALRSLMRVVEQAGVESDGVVFAPLASAKALTTKKQREGGVVLIDIGASTTSMAVYEEGELLHCASIPIGSAHITSDLALGLRTNLDIADSIKLKYGTVMSDKIRDSETINLSVLDPAEDERVPRKQVAEIIEARVLEIFQRVRQELSKVSRDGLLPAGAVFTGGGSELDGLTELARHQLRLPATIGFPSAKISGMLDKVDNPIYATGVGLVLWGYEEQEQQRGSWRANLGKLGGVFDQFRGILRNFTN